MSAEHGSPHQLFFQNADRVAEAFGTGSTNPVFYFKPGENPFQSASLCSSNDAIVVAEGRMQMQTMTGQREYPCALLIQSGVENPSIRAYVRMKARVEVNIGREGEIYVWENGNACVLTPEQETALRDFVASSKAYADIKKGVMLRAKLIGFA